MSKKTNPKSTESERDPRTIKVAEKIRKLRKEKGYTSHETFAWDHDLPRVQYWRMESGQNFRFESLLKILDALEISLQDFFSTIDDE